MAKMYIDRALMKIASKPGLVFVVGNFTCTLLHI